jgi:hypothetical protein
MEEIIGYNDVIMRRIIQLLTLDGEIDSVKKISTLSWYHNVLSKPYLQLLKGSSFDCQCNCKEMLRFKIYDEVRKWKCNGCKFKLDSFNSGCWTKKRVKDAKIPICDKCYWKHWHLVGIRPLDKCLNTPLINR